MISRNGSELFRPLDPDKTDETLEVVFVRLPSLVIGDVRKPLNFGWNVGEALALGGSEAGIRGLSQGNGSRILVVWEIS